MKRTFPFAERFCVISFECKGWRPKHPLDLPGACIAGEWCSELTYRDEQPFRTREECMAQMAADNRDFVGSASGDRICYSVVVEFMPAKSWWATFDADRGETFGGPERGAAGYMSIQHFPFRIAVPTADEVQALAGGAT